MWLLKQGLKTLSHNYLLILLSKSHNRAKLEYHRNLSCKWFLCLFIIPFEDLAVNWGDNIKIDLEQIERKKWIGLIWLG